jgi:hypothetical protein
LIAKQVVQQLLEVILVLLGFGILMVDFYTFIGKIRFVGRLFIGYDNVTLAG